MQPGIEFTSDNAPIHTDSTLENQFNENGIPLADWLPYSLDLNATEHPWAKFKEHIYLLYPTLNHLKILINVLIKQQKNFF